MKNGESGCMFVFCPQLNCLSSLITLINMVIWPKEVSVVTEKAQHFTFLAPDSRQVDQHGRAFSI